MKDGHQVINESEMWWKDKIYFFAPSNTFDNQMLNHPALLSFENWIQNKDLDICSVLTAL